MAKTQQRFTVTMYRLVIKLFPTLLFRWPFLQLAYPPTQVSNAQIIGISDALCRLQPVGKPRQTCTSIPDSMMTMILYLMRCDVIANRRSYIQEATSLSLPWVLPYRFCFLRTSWIKSRCFDSKY